MYVSYMDTYFHTLSLEYVLQMSLDKKKRVFNVNILMYLGRLTTASRENFLLLQNVPEVLVPPEDFTQTAQIKVCFLDFKQNFEFSI